MLLMGIWMSKGASVDTYVRPEGELGTAHFDFKVAHNGGEPCPVCRATYFCPRCQPFGPGVKNRSSVRLDLNQSPNAC